MYFAVIAGLTASWLTAVMADNVYWIFNSSAPSATWSPGAYISSATTPSAGAAMVCSIFIASITASAWPLLTWSPALTANDTTLPGMGAVSLPVSAAASPAWASRSIFMICVAPRSLKT